MDNSDPLPMLGRILCVVGFIGLILSGVFFFGVGPATGATYVFLYIGIMLALALIGIGRALQKLDTLLRRQSEDRRRASEKV